MEEKRHSVAEVGGAPPAAGVGLAREMGILGLVATGVFSMVGAGINVVPIMVQRNVPGIGPGVTAAFALAMIPAVLAALAYAVLASGMPRAGGSYVYASRSLHPYLGFLASFSQWFGLSVAMGVVGYVLVPFVRDVALSFGLRELGAALDSAPIRVGLALAFLWTATAVNLLGIKIYERVMVALTLLGLVGGAIVIPTGFAFDHAEPSSFSPPRSPRNSPPTWPPGTTARRGSTYWPRRRCPFSSSFAGKPSGRRGWTWTISTRSFHRSKS